MALSYFHTVLFGGQSRQDTSAEALPLFEAIARSSRKGPNASTHSGDDLMQAASTEEAHSLIMKFSSRLFADASPTPLLQNSWAHHQNGSCTLGLGGICTPGT